MIKIISNIIIVGCCSAIGASLANQYVQRIRSIRVVQSILVQLETDTIHYSLLLPDAIEKSGKSVGGEWGKFFIKVAEILKNRKEYTVADAWQTSLNHSRKRLFLKQPEYEILYRFGGQLGRSDKESQLKYFQLVQHQLKIEEKNADEMRLKYEKMYRSLGVLSGLAIAIILI